MYDGGKSVLHVKNSAGGFYKVKKTGRLGKNCVHFSGRGICTKYDKWCSSANCPGYEKRKQRLHPNLWLGKSNDFNFRNIDRNLETLLYCVETEHKVPEMNLLKII